MAGATHRIAKIESDDGGAGSNGDASVKRRSGVRATHTQGRVCVCAPSGTVEARAGRRRQLLSPGGQLPHYPLPPRARPRARCTTRLAPLRSCDAPQSAATLTLHAIDIRIAGTFTASASVSREFLNFRSSGDAPSAASSRILEVEPARPKMLL